MMTEFPLGPRQSRIMVEAILKYPQVIHECAIAAAFLSANRPQLMPPGQEEASRAAHARFADKDGDFVSYLKLFAAWEEAPDKISFCEKNYLDDRAMAEIGNIVAQLEDIVSKMGIPIGRDGGNFDYLCAVSRGLVQFVCVRMGRDLYQSLTAERILIHPGSCMFHENPEYIVAGEIVRTARMYASSVSPLSMNVIRHVADDPILTGMASSLFAIAADERREAKRRAERKGARSHGRTDVRAGVRAGFKPVPTENRGNKKNKRKHR
jgi:hypothetical protein